MNNKEKFLTLVDAHDETVLNDMLWRKQNRKWLQKSQNIAIAILQELHRKGLTQKDLAKKMKVSPQVVNKWVKGRENFTLETISKIETALECDLISIPNSEINKAVLVGKKTKNMSEHNAVNTKNIQYTEVGGTGPMLVNEPDAKTSKISH